MGEKMDMRGVVDGDGGGALVLGCHAPHQAAEGKICFDPFVDIYLWHSLVRAGALTPDLLLPLPLD